MVHTVAGESDPVDRVMSAAAPAAPNAAGRIVVEDLTKTFGSFTAVDHLSFAVEPGSITGFLGPNGAGKTTTLRMLLGLVRPSSGVATIGGRPFSALHEPLKVVGAALEAASFHPGRTARNHLRVYCAAAGLPEQRADEVLAQVGLTEAARKKVRGYSLGMRQRLGLATTLLGDPQVLILDEPANGLDPDGIRWLRGFLRHLADNGRTVLVSSHQLAEMQAMADRVVILDHGRLVREGAIRELAAANDSVVVRTPTPAPLVERLRADLPGAEVADAGEPGLVRVRGAQISDIGHAAFLAGVELHELRHDGFDLEQLFFSLTSGAPR
jgi:ABC-2 type transport system ATP-binding protein